MGEALASRTLGSDGLDAGGNGVGEETGVEVARAVGDGTGSAARGVGAGVDETALGGAGGGFTRSNFFQVRQPKTASTARITSAKTPPLAKSNRRSDWNCSP